MLKSLNISELDDFASRLSPWAGGRLQAITGNRREIGLEFYKTGGKVFLWIDLSPQRPLPLLFETGFPGHRKSPLPIHHFLKAHYLGRTLVSAVRPSGLGRLLLLEFSGGEELELRLFPGGRNAIARCAGKTVSLAPVKKLAVLPEDDVSATDNRDLNEVRELWLAERRRKNRKITKTTSAQASIRANCTSATESRIVFERS